VTASASSMAQPNSDGITMRAPLTRGRTLQFSEFPLSPSSGACECTGVDHRLEVHSLMRSIGAAGRITMTPI